MSNYTSLTYTQAINFTNSGADNSTSKFAIEKSTVAVSATDVSLASSFTITKPQLEVFFSTSNSGHAMTTEITKLLNAASTKSMLLARINSNFELDKRWSDITYVINLDDFAIYLQSVDPGIDPVADDKIQFVFKFHDNTVNGTNLTCTVGVSFTIA